MFPKTLPGIRAMAMAFLAGAALAANAAAPAKRYLITDSGAVGDGRTLNTKAIQLTGRFLVL